MNKKNSIFSLIFCISLLLSFAYTCFAGAEPITIDFIVSSIMHHFKQEKQMSFAAYITLSIKQILPLLKNGPLNEQTKKECLLILNFLHTLKEKNKKAAFLRNAFQGTFTRQEVMKGALTLGALGGLYVCYQKGKEFKADHSENIRKNNNAQNGINNLPPAQNPVEQHANSQVQVLLSSILKDLQQGRFPLFEKKMNQVYLVSSILSLAPASYGYTYFKALYDYKLLKNKTIELQEEVNTILSPKTATLFFKHLTIKNNKQSIRKML